jgi:hypothetical protein
MKKNNWICGDCRESIPKGKEVYLESLIICQGCNQEYHQEYWDSKESLGASSKIEQEQMTEEIESEDE